MTVIREPAVAGSFYPGDATQLGRTIEFLLGEVQDTEGAAPKALIVPHAGYIYSGPVAATAYARLRPHRNLYEKVVLLGPCHRVPVSGLALSGADFFRTPLGDVALDKEAIAGISSPCVRIFDRTHTFEHSLEVHLPFLQRVLGGFVLVPIVVGNAMAEEVASVLDELWGGPETLIVVSSDLCHYLGYEEARRVDGHTREAIEHFDFQSIGPDTACGATPIGGLLLAARRHAMTVTTLDLRNSGDTAGDRRNVVGYGAWMFAEQ